MTRTRLTPGTLAGILLALALAVIAATLAVVSSGDGDPAATAPSPAVAQPAPQEEASASELPTEQPTATDGVVEDPDNVLPLVTYEIFLSRDPFEPLVPTAGGTTGGTTDGGSDGGTTGETTGGTDGETTGGTTDGTDGGTDGTDGGTDGETTGGTTGGTTGDVTGGECVKDSDQDATCRHVVHLVDVFVDDDGTERAVVQVDDRLYEVTAGQRFANNFEVRSIDPPCVTLLYGDDAFTLCEGEQVLK